MSGETRRICLFAQFHPRQRIRPPVLAYVGALQRCGYQTYVACSGDAPPPDEDRAALAATGAVVLARRNGGLDFGAWQHLIRQGCADGADRVLLANDSVFGPLRPLAPMLERMEARGDDVWGMIESEQRGWHLQSWFLQFTGAAFRHSAVQHVFDQNFAAMDKATVIEHGELALGQALQRAGFRCGALIRFADGSRSARRHRLNMMHLDWRHNLLAFGAPFIKVELLRDNPMRLPWVPAWERVLREQLGVETAEYAEYLFDYTGIPRPETGATFPVPVRKLPIRLLLGFLLATHDRAFALRHVRPDRLRLRMPPGGLASLED